MNARRALLVRCAPLLALGLGGCLNAYPQRLPGPLPVAEGESSHAPAPPSSITVTLQRDSDPVWVRRPGSRGDRALPFYEKRERVPAGALVRTGAGGRAELFWAPDASALALFEEGRLTLGDPARDEPMVRFHSLTRAVLVLTPEDRVELVGGAILAGDPLETTATLLLEALPSSLQRITNQSKRLATISFREERLEVGPGESVDLPTVTSGAAPRAAEPEPQRFEREGVSVALLGRVEHAEATGGVRLTALEPATIRALWIEARLAPGESASFSGLSRGGPHGTLDPDAPQEPPTPPIP